MSLTMGAKAPIAVKICGITQVQQALKIASIGADAIGVIGVSSSPRFVADIERRTLFDELIKNAPFIERVWVTADLDISEISKAIKGNGPPTILQLHGHESKEKCQEIKKLSPKIKLWKSFQIRQPNDLVLAEDYQDSVDGILLDAWSKNSLGGTGKRVPIEWLSQTNFYLPWWLAGGISSDCIKEILSNIIPFGIDASSKLETKPGIKDMQKVKDLLKAVRKF